MTTPVWLYSVWLPLALNIAAFFFLTCKRACGPVLLFQGVSAFASLPMIYCAARGLLESYQLMFILVDAACAGLKLLAIIHLVRMREESLAKSAAVASLAVYLVIQIHWSLQSYAFVHPEGAWGYLNPARKVCWACSLACLMVMYSRRDATASGENHCTKMM